MEATTIEIAGEVDGEPTPDMKNAMIAADLLAVDKDMMKEVPNGQKVHRTDPAMSTAGSRARRMVNHHAVWIGTSTVTNGVRTAKGRIVAKGQGDTGVPTK